jgi:hypothetical protein
MLRLEAKYALADHKQLGKCVQLKAGLFFAPLSKEMIARQKTLAIPLSRIMAVRVWQKPESWPHDKFAAVGIAAD